MVLPSGSATDSIPESARTSSFVQPVCIPEVMTMFRPFSIGCAELSDKSEAAVDHAGAESRLNVGAAEINTLPLDSLIVEVALLHRHLEWSVAERALHLAYLEYVFIAARSLPAVRTL